MTIKTYISKEEAEALELAYGKVLAHLKRAKNELEEAKKADPLEVVFARIDVSENDILYIAWHRILRKHPLMKQMFETADPQGVDYFMWSIGLSPDAPPIEAQTILWAFEEIEKRRNSIEEQITLNHRHKS